MGGSVSAPINKAASRDVMSKRVMRPQTSYNTVMKLVLPPFYQPDPVSPDDIASALDSWNTILQDNAPKYNKLVEKNNRIVDQYPRAQDFFTGTFFDRLYHLNPQSKTVLEGTRDRNYFVSRMINFCLTELEEESTMVIVLESLAEMHHTRGVRAAEYGIMTEALLYSLRETLGLGFPPAVESAWVRVFSRILRIVVPTAVTLDMDRNAFMDSESMDAQMAYYHSIHQDGASQYNNDKKSSRRSCPSQHVQPHAAPSACMMSTADSILSKESSIHKSSGCPVHCHSPGQDVPNGPQTRPSSPPSGHPNETTEQPSKTTESTAPPATFNKENTSGGDAEIKEAVIAQDGDVICPSSPQKPSHGGKQGRRLSSFATVDTAASSLESTGSRPSSAAMRLLSQPNNTHSHLVEHETQLCCE